MAVVLPMGRQQNNASVCLSYSFLGVTGGEDILHSLISVSEIVFDLDVIRDLEEDNWESYKEGGTQQDPVADELRHKWELASIQVVHDSCTDGLDSLVETDIVGQTATGVGESTHVPESVLAWDKK